MRKSNIFYLFLVAIFLTLSVLSFYWFNNVDNYTDTHDTNKNFILESSVNIWNKFNTILSFLDIIGDNSKNQNDYKDIDMFDDLVENEANNINTLEINEEVKTENKSEEQEMITKSVNDIIKEKEWYKNSNYWLSKKGFYVSKNANILELGWQGSQGKTHSISIPY